MRYVQLRAFHHVAIHGGFSKAAKALNLSQPAISDQVRFLEEAYDILLFNRAKKQITLTEPGKRLLEVTRRLFENEQQALELLQQTQTLSAGRLRIVADAPHHLLHLLGSFRKSHPRVTVSLHTRNTSEVLEMLAAYEADIGVLGELPTRKDIEILQLSTAPIIAFAALDYPLGKRGSLTLKSLSEHPLVMREEGSKTRRIFEAAAAEQGVKIRPAIEAEGREAVREIVASGAGIGIVSEAEFGHDTRLLRIPILDAEITMQEALVCLRERRNGKLIRAFMNLAREEGEKAA